jgi:TonB family protein
MSSFLLAYLLNALWQLPLVFAAAWFAMRLLRRLGPAVEHRIGCATLILSAILPACKIDFFPMLALLHRSHAARGETITISTGDLHALGAAQLPPILPHLILATYAAVCLYCIARLLWVLHKTTALGCLCRPSIPSGEIAGIWDRCADHFAVVDAQLVLSTEVSGPVTIGNVHRLLLLPAAWIDSVPAEDLEVAIAHEFAHMRRRDFAKNLAYQIVSLPIAWHPVTWLTRSRITESREALCDELAAEAFAGRQQYARSLVRLASKFALTNRRPQAHAIGIFDANHFERRIMKLTQPVLELRGIRRIVATAACLLLGFGACASALVLRIDVNPPTPAAPPAQPSPVAAPMAPHAAPPAMPAPHAVPATPRPPMAAAVSEPPAAAVQTSDTARSISGGVMAGNILSRVAPVYPPDAKSAGIEGVVVLRAIIGKEGRIENLTVVSGPRELAVAALEAVKQWVYRPYLLNGEPTEVDTTITVNFQLGSK